MGYIYEGDFEVEIDFGRLRVNGYLLVIFFSLRAKVWECIFVFFIFMCKSLVNMLGF